MSHHGRRSIGNWLGRRQTEQLTNGLDDSFIQNVFLSNLEHFFGSQGDGSSVLRHFQAFQLREVSQAQGRFPREHYFRLEGVA